MNEEHERFSKLLGGYTAFVAAILVATFAKSGDYPRAWVVISLLALSLPSLVACMLLDFIVRVKQTRKKSVYRGLAFALGFGPSLLGIAILIGHFSVIASVLFVLLTAFWCLLIFSVAILGSGNPKSDI
jgi:hypothetical protein